jgi:hypothetical protein
MTMLRGTVLGLALGKCHKCGRPGRGARIWSKADGVARATEHLDGTPTCIEDEGEDTVITRPPEKAPPEKDTLIIVKRPAE